MCVFFFLQGEGGIRYLGRSGGRGDVYKRQELLRSGIIEAKTGSYEAARRYLDRAIYMTSSHDVLAEAWFWMGEVLSLIHI